MKLITSLDPKQYPTMYAYCVLAWMRGFVVATVLICTVVMAVAQLP